MHVWNWIVLVVFEIRKIDDKIDMLSVYLCIATFFLLSVQDRRFRDFMC